MRSCFSALLVFIFGVFLIVMIWKTGVYVYFQNALLLLIELIETILKAGIDLLQNGYTAPDYNELFNL